MKKKTKKKKAKKTNKAPRGVTIGLGSRLRGWRKERDLKAFELAKLIKVSQGSLSDVENEKSLPSADTIANIMNNTDINIHWLLTGREKVVDSGKAGDPAYKTIYAKPGTKVLIVCSGK